MYRKKKSHDDSAAALSGECFGCRRNTLHKLQPEMASRMSSRQRDTDRRTTDCQPAILSTLMMRKAFRSAISFSRLEAVGKEKIHGTTEMFPRRCG